MSKLEKQANNLDSWVYKLEMWENIWCCVGNTEVNLGNNLENLGSNWEKMVNNENLQEKYVVDLKENSLEM